MERKKPKLTSDELDDMLAVDIGVMAGMEGEIPPGGWPEDPDPRTIQEALDYMREQK